MIQNIKRAQSVLNKCNPPTGVWSESYRHEIRLTAELMLIAARLCRAVITSRQHSPEPSSQKDSEKRPVTQLGGITKSADCQHSSTRNTLEKMDNLQPTFRTDIANK